MKKNQQFYDARRNQDVSVRLEKLEAMIEQEKTKTLRLKEENIELQTMVNALNKMRSSRLSITIKKLYKYVTGKKSRKALFNRSFANKQATKKMNRVTYRLYQLGFETKALAELEELFEKTDNSTLKKLAAWELAIWHGKHRSITHAKKALIYLTFITKRSSNKTLSKKIAVMKAESYLLLNEQAMARQIVKKELTKERQVDLFLAMANTYGDITERVEWINKALSLFDLTHLAVKTTEIKPRLLTAQPKTDTSTLAEPLITVIVPVFNAENVIETTIQSLTEQTWRHLEVIVADDCSTDKTSAIVSEMARRDDRIKLIQTEKNGGEYQARNTALKIATGEFVTINSADEWSHPEKIAIQAKQLLAKREMVANTSQQATATGNLEFYQRGKAGTYTIVNHSSLMFRRSEVMDKLGYWDSVRFGADQEFKQRLKQVFGSDAVIDLVTGPLSFADRSLSEDAVGVQREYIEAYSDYHERHQNELYYPFPQQKRLFPVPEPIWSTREKKNQAGRRHFDVIIASEFRLLGGTNMSNIEEIKAQQQMGLKTGLVQLARYDLNSVEQINPNVRALINGNDIQLVSYGERVSCDVLIVRHPPILQEIQKYLPDIDAKSIKVIINQAPKREYSTDGQWLYDFKTTAKNLKTYFGKPAKWYPIGPVIRQALHEHHQDELKWIDLAAEDWVNIINVGEWTREQRPKTNGAIKIGRHSRDQYVKWPNDRETFLKIYPDKADYEVHVLGGVNAPKKILGELPDNWHAYPFGHVEPRAFLAKLDVFIYYTNPDWVEAFGRVIFEAMAVGVPVIIPPSYQTLFGKSAIYAEPDEVEVEIKRLVNDHDYYHNQVKIAQQYVEQHFGHTKHADRIRAHIFEQ